jgi:hypothetical protein
MAKVLGFTGTRRGMTLAQKRAIEALLGAGTVLDKVLVHGDCIGADADMHALARAAGMRVEIRPCNLNSQRAGCQADKYYDTKSPLARNRDIVEQADVMLACPSGFKEELRSGTWATVRHAKKRAKPLFIAWPNGALERA